MRIVAIRSTLVGQAPPTPSQPPIVGMRIVAITPPQPPFVGMRIVAIRSIVVGQVPPTPPQLPFVRMRIVAMRLTVGQVLHLCHSELFCLFLEVTNDIRQLKQKENRYHFFFSGFFLASFLDSFLREIYWLVCKHEGRRILADSHTEKQANTG
jgi:hypothetical protein